MRTIAAARCFSVTPPSGSARALSPAKTRTCGSDQKEHGRQTDLFNSVVRSSAGQLLEPAGQLQMAAARVESSP